MSMVRQRQLQIAELNNRFRVVSAILRQWTAAFLRLGAADGDTPDTYGDPLSHPAIRAMSSRELADLPLPSVYRGKPE